mmetsp:Transcript_129209/g.313893  ORF Transcript_129209/g.313893 Transcript_129209/m.313893 type:complete len:211 (+) Transcript_129209:511-1143(+)
MISRWNVACSSGWVTCAFLKRRAIGRIKRSNFGGLRVKPSPTTVTFVTIRFHCFCLRFPLFTTLNISSSAIGRTLGTGTAHRPAFSLRFCLTVLLSTFARLTPSRSSKYAGTAPFGTESSVECLLLRSLCSAMVFFMATFSLKRCLLYSLARRPCTFCAYCACECARRASFFRARSWKSRRTPWRFRCSSICSFCGMVAGGLVHLAPAFS